MKTLVKLKKTLKAYASLINNIKKQFIKFNESMKKIWATAAVFAVIIAMQSCNVTRVITNKSEYTQRGDTAVMIQTKITETYDATKKN